MSYNNNLEWAHAEAKSQCIKPRTNFWTQIRFLFEDFTTLNRKLHLQWSMNIISIYHWRNAWNNYHRHFQNHCNDYEWKHTSFRELWSIFSIHYLINEMQILRSANIPWLVSFYLDRMSHVISILTPFLIFMVVSIISQESVFVKSDPVRACLLPAIFFLFKPGQALCWCHMTYISAIIYYSIWYAGGNKEQNTNQHYPL